MTGDTVFHQLFAQFPQRWTTFRYQHSYDVLRNGFQTILGFFRIYYSLFQELVTAVLITRQRPTTKWTSKNFDLSNVNFLWKTGSDCRGLIRIVQRAPYGCDQFLAIIDWNRIIKDIRDIGRFWEVRPVSSGIREGSKVIQKGKTNRNHFEFRALCTHFSFSSFDTLLIWDCKIVSSINLII